MRLKRLQRPSMGWEPGAINRTSKEVRAHWPTSKLPYAFKSPNSNDAFGLPADQHMPMISLVIPEQVVEKVYDLQGNPQRLHTIPTAGKRVVSEVVWPFEVYKSPECIVTAVMCSRC